MIGDVIDLPLPPVIAGDWLALAEARSAALGPDNLDQRGAGFGARIVVGLPDVLPPGNAGLVSIAVAVPPVGALGQRRASAGLLPQRDIAAAFPAIEVLPGVLVGRDFLAPVGAEPDLIAPRVGRLAPDLTRQFEDRWPTWVGDEQLAVAALSAP